MSADAVIEQLRKMSPEEVDRVGDFIRDCRAEREAGRTSAERIQELREGRVKPLSEEEVFGAVRANIREA